MMQCDVGAGVGPIGAIGVGPIGAGVGTLDTDDLLDLAGILDLDELDQPAGANPGWASTSTSSGSTSTSGTSSTSGSGLAKVDPSKRAGEAGGFSRTGRKRKVLTKETVAMLKGWMFSAQHVNHPYPDESEKQRLADTAGVTKKQVANWFTNARSRLWLPMMRARASRSDWDVVNQFDDCF
jgi:hypothetical protein